MRYRAVAMLLWVGLAGCGEGRFSVSNTSYEPRLVIEGLLRPGIGVDGIRITRNVRVDERIRTDDLIPADVQAHLTDRSNGRSFALTLRDADRVEDRLFYYSGSDLRIVPGASYALDVSASVEGALLRAGAVTTVPEDGFRIAGVNRQAMPYRPLDERGDPLNFALSIERSPSSRFYLLTLRPRVVTSANFIYENSFTQQSRQDVEGRLDDFGFRWDWIQNTPRGAGVSTIEVMWFDLWFYGDYDVLVYAADDNYARFIQTHDQVREADGNFHEAEFAIEGDGIGYFGSALVDSVRLQVQR